MTLIFHLVSLSTLSGEAAALQAMEDIYNKHGGDLDLIFAELNANPAKAKKPHNRPKSSSGTRMRVCLFVFVLCDVLCTMFYAPTNSSVLPSYCPNRVEFAKKFLGGFYNLLEDAAAEAAGAEGKDGRK